MSDRRSTQGLVLVCGFVLLSRLATVFLLCFAVAIRATVFSCAGVVLAALALERFLVWDGQRGFSNAEKGFVDPGKRTSRKGLGECGLDR